MVGFVDAGVQDEVEAGQHFLVVVDCFLPVVGALRLFPAGAAFFEGVEVLAWVGAGRPIQRTSETPSALVVSLVVATFTEEMSALRQLRLAETLPQVHFAPSTVNTPFLHKPNYLSTHSSVLVGRPPLPRSAGLSETQGSHQKCTESIDEPTADTSFSGNSPLQAREKRVEGLACPLLPLIGLELQGKWS